MSHLSWLDLPRPLVVLAPMDGYTDPPFRRFIKTVAPRSVVFSEFLPAQTIARKPSLAETMFKIYDDEKPVVIQLYGKDPGDFAAAAKLAEEQGASGVDINMGCPSKKVVAHRHGSALMKEIDLACEIIAAVKAAISVPVSVKTRLGWEHDRDLIPFIQKLEAVGLDSVTIHGRTYSQKFDGEADWRPIYALKEAVSIPVLGNGDVTSAAIAREKLGNLDGVMVGRGAVADPWLMEDVCLTLKDGKSEADRSFLEKLPYWKRFAEMAVEHWPMSEARACHAFRKYLVRLHKGLGLSPEVRSKAVKVETLAEVHAVLDLFGQAPQAETNQVTA